MSSEGNVSNLCRTLVFLAVSAVIIINEGLTGGPGRAITQDSRAICENAKALFSVFFHL